jgi:predicted CXXCH cytochrome family protein
MARLFAREASFRSIILFVVSGGLIVSGLPLGPSIRRKAATPTNPSFVTSGTCRTCHRDKYETWVQTSHANDLQQPSSKSVLGRFHGLVIDTPYFRANPYQKGEQFFVKVEARDGRSSADHQISHVVGKTIEQSYLFTGPRGEWRILPISWNVDRAQWELTHRVLAEISGDMTNLPDNFDSRERIFNDGCGQCHATHYDIGYDEQKGLYNSSFVEGSVACESCHGPGSAHVEWHKTGGAPDSEYQWPVRLFQPAADLDAKGVLASCGRCHYRHEWRFAIDDDPRVPFSEIAISRNHDGPGFFADGRFLGLNYDGTTQSQSACFRGGMSCLSCHEMHGGRPKALKWEATSDKQCSQCHAQIAAGARQHGRHQDLRCVDCHMPKRVSGILRFMRDHSLGSPEPELTERYGEDQVPNACGVCHQKESPRWAREWKDRWWRPAPRALVQNVGLVVALRKGARVCRLQLVEMAEAPENPLFFRLTAIRQLARYHETDSRAALRRLLFDPHEEIRQLASLGIGEDPHPQAAVPLLKLLDDPCRVVRVEAAYALARCGWRGNTAGFEGAYTDALRMLERQRAFDDVLERLVVLADALERKKEMLNYLSLLSGKQTLIRTIGDLLDRYARTLIEEGQFDQALEFCKKAEDQHEQAHSSIDLPLRERLLLDYADALAGLGRKDEAMKYWENMITSGQEDSLAYLIARARRLSLSSEASSRKWELEAAMLRAEKNPAAGELRRRAVWTLRVLGRSEGN